MEHSKVKNYLKGKTKMITLRINPKLLILLDETIEKDKAFDTRNEFLEGAILDYLEKHEKL